MIGKNIAVRKLGVVEVHARSAAGSGIKKQLEVDFVANKGYERYYVQSAYAFSDEEKQAKEIASFFSYPGFIRTDHCDRGSRFCPIGTKTDSGSTI